MSNIPTPVSYAHHILTVLGTDQPQQNTARQIDVRKIASWEYVYNLPSYPSLWAVKLRINADDSRPYIVPDAGGVGTGWTATKNDSLANGG